MKIMRIVLKDFRAYSRTIFVNILFLWLTAGAMMAQKFGDIHMYAMHASLTILFASAVYVLKEKSCEAEIFSCSLPVSRKQVVLARYLASGWILLAGVSIWIALAWIANQIFPGKTIEFSKILKAEILILPFIFQCAAISLFLPAAFRFGMKGSISLFALSAIAALLLAIMGIRPYTDSISTQWNGNRLPLIGMILVLVLLPASIALSVRLYRRKDL